MTIEYTADRRITPKQFVDVLERSTLGERRPIDDPACIESMLEHANLLCTAWESDTLIGVARSLTDFTYCCYLSDLAVDVRHQRRGIGRELIRRTQSRLAPRCRIILLAAPNAVGYYPRIGFSGHDSAWLLGADQKLA